MQVLEKIKIIRRFEFQKALLFFLCYAGLFFILVVQDVKPAVANSDNKDQRYGSPQSAANSSIKLGYNEGAQEIGVSSSACDISSIQLLQFEYNYLDDKDLSFAESYASYKQSIELTNKLTAKHQAIKQIDFEILATSPHDINAYTQGLVYFQNALYESTGGIGRSELRQLNIKTGKVIHVKKIMDHYFAEGLTRVGQHLIQLSLKKNIAHIYTLKNFELIHKFQFKGDGWGLVEKDNELLISNGSAKLQRVSTKNYTMIKEENVTVKGVALKGINEMEMVEGWLFANILPTNCIAIIDPVNYQVVAWLNLEKIYPESERLNSFSVLNGMAYNKAEKILMVTGKYWPQVFHLKLNNLTLNKEKNGVL
ncbi:hypothetical protein MNBD_GAMMA07-89 [hydrothermal vent metagenome]|uniref:Glutamine cyclotransferase n=1 Tax=hydrothermal vent metagenome TaxID=652676 RepID=A0A3B0WMP7_9ZZZZ